MSGALAAILSLGGRASGAGGPCGGGWAAATAPPDIGDALADAVGGGTVL